jgi:O-antigen/teichoic acid export membrane protein
MLNIKALFHKHNRVNKDTVLPIIFSGLSAVISIATTFLIAKPIGTEKYGNVQYYVGIINTLGLIMTYGFATFLSKESQFQSGKKAFFSKCFLWMCCLAAATLPVFLLVGTFALSGLHQNFWLVVCLFVCGFLLATCSLIGPFLIGIHKASLGVLFETFLPRLLLFVASVAFVGFSAYDAFVNNYIYIYIVAFGAITIPFLFVCLRKPLSLKISKTQIASISVYFVLNASATIQSNLSKIILGEASSSFDTVGIFSLCLQIVTMGTLFSSVISSISRPDFALLGGGKDRDALFAYFRKITRINCYISIPFLMAFIIEAKNVLLLFGTDYAAYPLMMVLLGIGYLAFNLVGPLGTMLVMSGHEKIELINSISTILVFFVLGISLAKITVYALPIAIMVSDILSSIAKYVETLIIYKKNPYNWELLIHVILILCISGIVFYSLTFITSGTYFLLANVVFGIVLICGFLFITPFKDDKYFFFRKKSDKPSPDQNSK